MDRLCRVLLDALDAFDRQVAPYGLYACEEYGAREKPYPRLDREWHAGLKPRLRPSGYRSEYANPREGQFRIATPDGASARMEMARISKVKVRKFGSAYRVDPHHRYQERWNELRLDRRLGRLWLPSALAERGSRLDLFILIGFAVESEPLEKELSLLREQLEWEQHGVVCETRRWPDRYDRRFHVRVCGWYRASAPEGPRADAA